MELRAAATTKGGAVASYFSHKSDICQNFTYNIPKWPELSAELNEHNLLGLQKSRNQLFGGNSTSLPVLDLPANDMRMVVMEEEGQGVQQWEVGR